MIKMVKYRTTVYPQISAKAMGFAGDNIVFDYRNLPIEERLEYGIDEIIHFPKKCACCGENADSSKDIYCMDGKFKKIQYCSSCLNHAKKYHRKYWIMGLIPVLILFLTLPAVVNNYFTYSFLRTSSFVIWNTFIALIMIGISIFIIIILKYFIHKSATKSMKGTCSSPDFAIKCVDRKEGRTQYPGTTTNVTYNILTFECMNESFAREFAGLNNGDVEVIES